MVIKKIFNSVFDEEVHSDFLKFGKGEFKGKFLIEAKKQKDKWAVKTGPEFANFFVKKCLEDVEDKIWIKGLIVSTFDLSNEIKFPVEKIKNFMGVRQVVINAEANKSDILELIEKHPRAFFALSFSTPKNELKIKPKSAKSAKPSKKQGEQKPNFCSLKTKDENIIRELFFDFPNFNEIKIKHTIKVERITYPKEDSDLKPEEIREKSKRKGVLIREVEVKKKKKIREVEFEA